MKLFIVLSLSLLVVVTLIKAKSITANKEAISVSQKENFEQRKGSNDEAIDLLRRLTREAVNPNTDRKGKAACKYRKGQWSACDPEMKVRTRTFTLKKGDVNTCEATKTLRKECKGKEGRKGGDGKQRSSSKDRKNQNPDKSLRSRT